MRTEPRPLAWAAEKSRGTFMGGFAIWGIIVIVLSGHIIIYVDNDWG